MRAEVYHSARSGERFVHVVPKHDHFCRHAASNFLIGPAACGILGIWLADGGTQNMLLRGLLFATFAMPTHADIDRRVLGMIRLCVQKIEADPRLLARLWNNAERIADPRIRKEWREFRTLPWIELKARLLADTPDGDQMRQNAPFGGLLSNRERIFFFRTDLKTTPE